MEEGKGGQSYGEAIIQVKGRHGSRSGDIRGSEGLKVVHFECSQ